MNRNGAGPSATLRIHGDDRGPAAGREINAGGLSFALDGMALRWLRRGDVELLRGIALVVRDSDWGTYSPAVRLEREERQDGCLRLWLAAEIAGGGARLSCRVTVEVTEGALAVASEATAAGEFRTNRAGFVVLHPAGCAGDPVRVEHMDGTTTEGAFPRLISPHQPFRSMRAIEHRPAAGLVVRTRFAGEVFEMEDQRNWSDASFKTYSRPLDLPFPYVIGDGETVRQSVRVTVEGKTRRPGRSPANAVRIRVRDEAAGRMPRLAIGGRPRDYVGGDVARARLAALRPLLLLAEIDATGASAAHAEALRAAQAATGAGLALMLHPGRGDATSTAATMGVRAEAVALIDADAAMAEQARLAFPGARIGVGTDAFFAEFNRKPPNAAEIAADFVFWTVNPTVHAEDNASVMETLAVLSDQVSAARAHCPGVALWCGPVTLRMRFNPNAMESAAPEPADADARQRGLFGAAFTLGQIAAWAAAGIDTLVLHAPFGPRGLIHTSHGFPVPFYDELPEAAVYPAYHVLAGLTPCSGLDLRHLENAAPSRVAALAVKDALWLANLSPAPIVVEAPGDRVRLLDTESFLEAVRAPEGFWHRGTEGVAGGAVRLGPYAVARLTGV